MTSVKNTERAASPVRPQDIRALRAQAQADGQLPGGNGRMASFPAKMRGQTVTFNEKSFYEVEGYATVFEKGYEMWDMFGPFTEIADTHMLDWSLARNPDVAFLTNHKGMTMARTKMTKPTLVLAKDTTGLKINALLNLDRQDVRDLASAIDDELIDEMSFAFMLEEGEWNDDFSVFRILKADIDRGDVSAVNYGANPYTSIGARAQEFMRTLEDMPQALKSAAFARLVVADDAPEMIRAAVTLSNKGQDRFIKAGREMAMLEAQRNGTPNPFSDWEIDDQTGEDDNASTGESATDGDEAQQAAKARAMSTSELSVNLSDTEDDDDEISADQRSAGDSTPDSRKGHPVNLVRNRLAAMLGDEDE